LESIKMIIKTIALTMACALLALSAGCSSSGPVYEETLLDKNWGRSVETAKYNQILNPDAEKNLTPVEGLSGKAVDNSVQKYENSFKKEGKPEGTYTSTTTAIKE
jgi:hypothetical protein